MGKKDKKKAHAESDDEENAPSPAVKGGTPSENAPMDAKTAARKAALKEKRAARKKPAAGAAAKPSGDHSGSEEDDDAAMLAQELQRQQAAKKASKKTKKAPATGFAALADGGDDDSDEEEDHHSESEAEEEPTPPKPAPAPQKGGGGGGKKDKKKADKDKKKKKKDDDFDWDNPEDLDALDTPAQSEEPTQLTKAQLKRLRKKAADTVSDTASDAGAAEPAPAAAAAPTPTPAPAAAEEPKEPEPEATSGKGKKGKPVKLSAAAQLAVQRRLDREAREREEAEFKRKEEEEAARQAAEEAAAEEAKRLKKEEAAKRKEQAKKEGTFLTKKERQAQEKAAQIRNELIAAGKLDPSALEHIKEEGAPKKTKYEKKKTGGSQSTFAKKQEEAAKLAELEAKRLAEEEAAKRAAADAEDGVGAQAPVADSWEDLDSWEDAAVPEPASAVPEPASAAAPEEKLEEAPATPIAPSPAPAPSKTPDTGSAIRKSVTGSPALDSAKHVMGGGDDLRGALVGSRNRKKLTKKQQRELERLEKEEEEKKTSTKHEMPLRSPIVVIMGHVDTGKTKLLDKIRRTNVQDKEAGGITQQIGATFFPMANIRAQTDQIDKKGEGKYDVPGLLIIDTPGHESFTNLRSRGSSLCDVAILVVDIMAKNGGIENQTLESLNMLKARKTSFIIALNKVDRIYQWKAYPGKPIRDTLLLQDKSVQLEFNQRVNEVVAAFAMQGLNAALYYKNKDLGHTVSIVPTSAHSGEGIPDMLLLLTQLTQKRMAGKLRVSPELQCTVLEVKQVEGLGTTIDVILVNGILHSGDRIVVGGFQGPIATTIRTLLTPQPMKELRVKGEYLHHEVIHAAMGLKIVAPDLEKAMAGTELFVVGPDDDEEEIKERLTSDLESITQGLEPRGVCVQASTLGSMEALLAFLRDSEVPVSMVNLGPVHRKDVQKAVSLLERCPEYAMILAFDVKVDKEVALFAEQKGIRIFTADIIYHLFDQFKLHMAKWREEKKKEAAGVVVFPCQMKILDSFAQRNPIILGVKITKGLLRPGCQIFACDPPEAGQKTLKSETVKVLGTLVSIEKDHEEVAEAKKGMEVAIKIDQTGEQQAYQYNRHFFPESPLFTKISAASIVAINAHFKDELSDGDLKLQDSLRALLKIR